MYSTISKVASVDEGDDDDDVVARGQQRRRRGHRVVRREDKRDPCARARMCTVEVGGERLGSKKHGWGGGQALGPEEMRSGWETSARARIDTVGVEEEQLRSRGHGWSGG